MKMNIYVLSSIFFICGLLSSAIGSDIDQCPKGVPRNRFLRTFKGQCYQFNNFERRWNDAQRYCSNYHGHLVVIKSAEEQNFIMSSLRKLHWNRNGVWIGATDRHKEMHWQWLTGETISYSNWASGQPSCSWLCIEDCGQLRYRDGGKWHDYPCNSIPYLYSFICQYDMTPTTTTSTTTSTTTEMTTTHSSTTVVPQTTTAEKIEIVYQDLMTKNKGSSLNKVHNKTPIVTTTTRANNDNIHVLLNDGGQQHQMLGQEEDKAMPTGTTIALVLGILLGLMVGVCFGAVCFIRRRRKKPVEESSVGYANPYYGEAANQGPYSDDETSHIIDPSCTMKENSYVHDESLPSVSLNNPTYGKLVMAIDEEYDLPKPSPCGASSDTYENSHPVEENFYEDIDSVKATIALNEAREQKEEEEEDRYVAMPTKSTV
ncbi:macrophage mannose receptor 1 isoform X2 [Patella vulgata]|uniref:macrophage mannose receptor 1 isoform X2 n=1 Tax=Patella vulgata TaxID=6465 RepID=UPI0024A9A057|nr:macrophage mannose receptor 1 isoform X2 [Patella vulgata]